MSYSDNDRLSCKLCLDTFDEPRVLSCGHSMCTKCVNISAATSKPTTLKRTAFGNPGSSQYYQTKKVTCAHCNQETTLPEDGAQGLALNRDLAEICSNAAKKARTDEALECHCGRPAGFRCPECDLGFCENHQKYHEFLNFHQVVPITRETLRLVCQAEGHQENRATFYCNTCNKLGCAVCSLKTVHPQPAHDTIFIEDYALKAAENIKNIGDKTRNWMEKATKVLFEVGRVKEDLAVAHNNFVADVHEAHDAVVKKLDLRRDRLIAESQAIKTTRFARLNVQEAALRTTILRAKQVCDQSKLAQRASGNEVIPLAMKLSVDSQDFMSFDNFQLAASSKLKKLKVDPKDVIQAIDQMGAVESGDPATPRLRGCAISPTSIRLQWSHQKDVMVNLFGRGNNGHFKLLYQGPGDRCSCIIRNFEPNTEYGFIMQSENKYGDSQPTPELRIRTHKI